MKRASMQNLVITFLCLILLSSCDTSTLLEAFYFNRVKFTFADDAKESEYTYLCKKAENEEKTKEQAVLANQFFLTGLNRIAKEYSESLFKEIESETDETDKKNSEKNHTYAAIIKLEKQSEELALELESKFKCVLINSVDLE